VTNKPGLLLTHNLNLAALFTRTGEVMQYSSPEIEGHFAIAE